MGLKYFCRFESHIIFLLEVIKLFQCFMQVEQLSDYPAVKVNFQEFGNYKVIG